MKMKQTNCYETSAYKIQTPGNDPKERIQQDVTSLFQCCYGKRICIEGMKTRKKGSEGRCKIWKKSLPLKCKRPFSTDTSVLTSSQHLGAKSHEGSELCVKRSRVEFSCQRSFLVSFGSNSTKTIKHINRGVV